MRDEKAGYRRLLVVNDDDSREDFIRKYRGMEKWEEELFYYRNINDALRRLEKDGLFCCDKILLDIRIEWNAQGACAEDVERLVDVEKAGRAYGGFILYMYLLARGFPMDRIAFLSAYVTEEDSQREAKQAICEFLKECKIRNVKSDERLREMAEQALSQKANILRTLEAWSEPSRRRNLAPYRTIQNLLEKDLETGEVRPSSSGEAKETARSFFDKIGSTGLIVRNKIHKGDMEKLMHFIENEPAEELGRYYQFRAAALNICDRQIAYYEGLGEEKDAGIYQYADKSQRTELFRKYPPRYFAGVLSGVQNTLDLKTDSAGVQRISSRVVDLLISFWEGIRETRDQEEARINEFTVALTLKFTRNWRLHHLIEHPDVDFMIFIFALSAFALGYQGEELQILLDGQIELRAGQEPEGSGREAWAEQLLVRVNKALNKSVYVLSLTDLYGEYGRNSGTRKQIQTADLYELFWLCLHFPYIAADKTLKFVTDACAGKHVLLGKLEQLAAGKIRSGGCMFSP